MKHTPLLPLLLLPAALLLGGCKKHYRIHASSSVQSIEGRTLHLKVFKDGSMQSADSAQVIHGRLEFSGTIDSATMAGLFADEQCIMPVVLEEGDITLELQPDMQFPKGTAMNDTLAAFVKAKTKLEMEMDRLAFKESQMVMDGIPHDSVLLFLAEEANSIAERSEETVNSFIMANYDNILGPGVFMILTNSFPYPILNPQIETLLSMGTPYFLENPYVKEYVRVAKQNMERLRKTE